MPRSQGGIKQRTSSGCGLILVIKADLHVTAIITFACHIYFRAIAATGVRQDIEVLLENFSRYSPAAVAFLRLARLMRASPNQLAPSRSVESAGRAETGTGLTGALKRHLPIGVGRAARVSQKLWIHLQSVLRSARSIMAVCLLNAHCV